MSISRETWPSRLPWSNTCGFWHTFRTVSGVYLHIVRYICLLLILISLSVNAQAQLNASDTLAFEAYEDTINQFSEIMFTAPDEKTRKLASHNMILSLKEALERPLSYEYGFPGLNAISIVQPRDKVFRIFTWQYTFNNNTYRYYGAIQMRSDSLILHPLVDYSVVMDNVERLVTDNERWIGALYYDVVKVSDGKQDYYTLFGYDGNNAFSTKKLADVLWFTEDGEIRFGAPIFDTGEKIPAFRFILEYKKGVTATIRYAEEFGKILYDHLIPADDKSEGMYFNYVPDGSYEGFEWKKGMWQYVEKVFDFKLEDGEFPDGN